MTRAPRATNRVPYLVWPKLEASEAAFGSRARDEGSQTSDLDLLVEMERGRSLLDLIDMQRDIEEALGMKVDLLTPGSLSPYLRQAVEEAAIPL